MVQKDRWDATVGAKKVISCFAVPRPATRQAGRTGCLSIPAEWGRGWPRVGTIHVQAPTPQAPPFKLADLKNYPKPFSFRTFPLRVYYSG